MKSISDMISEGKAKPKDIEKDVKSWVTSCESFEDYLVVLKAICRGWSTGITENQKYYKDGPRQEAVDRIDDDLFNKWLALQNYTEYSKYLK